MACCGHAAQQRPAFGQIQYLRRIDQGRNEYDWETAVFRAISQQSRRSGAGEVPGLRRGGGTLSLLIFTQPPERPAPKVGITLRFAP